jgi:hypothetical protein
MTEEYIAARRIALGLEMEAPAQRGDDLWNVSVPYLGFARAEMPYQFFEKGFAAPLELEAQKAALMLYEDYDEDSDRAAALLKRLGVALLADDSDGLSALLHEAPLSDWLSLVLISQKTLNDTLEPALNAASDAYRQILGEALISEISRLVAFPELLTSLLAICEGGKET